MEIDEPERALEFESEFLEVEHPWIQQFSFTSRIIHFWFWKERKGDDVRDFEILFGFYGEAVFSEMMYCDGNVDGWDLLTVKKGAVTVLIGAQLRRRFRFKREERQFSFSLSQVFATPPSLLHDGRLRFFPPCQSKCEPLDHFIFRFTV